MLTYELMDDLLIAAGPLATVEVLPGPCTIASAITRPWLGRPDDERHLGAWHERVLMDLEPEDDE